MRVGHSGRHRRVGELVIRQVGAADAAAIYEICLRTADAGADASTLHRDPSLPGHVWAGAYPVLEPDHAFVLVAGDPSMRVVGYVLGAPDTAVFEQRLERDWWPPLRERYPRDGARRNPDASARQTPVFPTSVHCVHLGGIPCAGAHHPRAVSPQFRRP